MDKDVQLSLTARALSRSLGLCYMKGSYVIEQQDTSRSDGCCSPVYMDEFQTGRRQKESYVDQEVFTLCTLDVNMGVQ